MDMRVTIKQIKVVEFTYNIKGVNSIDEGRAAARKCYDTHINTDDCYLCLTVPRPPQVKSDIVEVIA